MCKGFSPHCRPKLPGSFALGDPPSAFGVGPLPPDALTSPFTVNVLIHGEHVLQEFPGKNPETSKEVFIPSSKRLVVGLSLQFSFKTYLLGNPRCFVFWLLALPCRRPVPLLCLPFVCPFIFKCSMESNPFCPLIFNAREVLSLCAPRFHPHGLLLLR